MTILVSPRAPPALRTSLSDVASSIDLPRSQEIGSLYALRENELAVVRLFGSVALSEVRELGARCEREGAFAAEVSRLKAPEVDLEGWAKLARVMPDYLIAAHTLRTFLGEAVTLNFYRGIPDDGKSLLTLARGLQRFSNQTELQFAVRAERGQALVPQAEPVWGRLSPSVLNTLCNRQRAGYELRLAIQPGGREILASLKDETPFSKSMTRVLSAVLAEAMFQLDSRDVGAIRALSRDYHNKRWMPFSPEEIAQGKLTGLKANDGSVFSPPKDLLNKISILHNRAWGQSRPLVAGVPDAPRSAAHAMRALQSNVPAELLKQNLDAIAALTWILEIGLMEDPHYELITGSVDSVLSLDTREDLSTTPQSDASPKIEGTEIRDEPQRRQPSILDGRKIEHPESIQVVREVRSSLIQNLFKQDLADLEPTFTFIDHLPGGIREPRFLGVVQQLRTIHARRLALIEATTVGLLSADAESLFLLSPSALSEEMLNNRELLESIPRSLRGDVERRILELYDVKQSLIERTRGETQHLLPLTALIEPTQLSVVLPKIRALLRPHLVEQYGTDHYRNFGGIFNTGSYLSALQHHVSEGGSILVPHKNSQGDGGLDGMFMYGQPGVYPELISELLMIVAPDRDLSFASLFITAPDRAPGTYMSLLKGMAARLALQGARYSLGTVGEENLRHHNLLIGLDHRPLRAASLTSDELGARFIPMLWELP